MKQERKNSLLIVILLVLIVGCVWAARFNPYQKSSSNADLPSFSIEDPAAQITEVSMRGPAVNNTLKKLSDTNWSVNDSLSLDPAMLQVLMALMERIEVQREVTGQEKEEVLKHVLDTGIQVNIRGEGINRNFTVGGSAKQIKSYFVENNRVYLIQLPGYESYVAGMFEVKTLDWRNRTIFPATWQDIVSMELNYPNGEKASFAYDKGLVKMQNTSNADSVKVMDYIETYNYFYVDQFLSESHPAVQQLADFTPAGSISINTLDPDKSLHLKFYQHPGFNAVLVRINDKEWAAIQKPRYQKLFPNKSNFQK